MMIASRGFSFYQMKWPSTGTAEIGLRHRHRQNQVGGHGLMIWSGHWLMIWAGHGLMTWAGHGLMT